MTVAYPDKTTAIDLFDNYWEHTSSTSDFSRDKWRAHSYCTAEAAAIIGEKLEGVIPQKAFVCGLLHDIGKNVDIAPKRHSLAGYHLLNALGYYDCARVALSHDFPNSHIEIWKHEGWLSEDEITFVGPLLNVFEPDIYDRLIQVCDVISLPEGYVLMEKRMLQAVMRSGLTASLKQIIEASYDNLNYLENLLGISIYTVLPNVIQNTFS
jgi:hypothetical protein